MPVLDDFLFGGLWVRDPALFDLSELECDEGEELLDVGIVLDPVLEHERCFGNSPQDPLHAHPAAPRLLRENDAGRVNEAELGVEVDDLIGPERDQ